jgi:hypothetical protein
MTRRPIRSAYDHSLTFSAETLGIRISFRAHQWMVDFGTPDSAAARSAVYAPVTSIAVKIPRQASTISFLPGRGLFATAA